MAAILAPVALAAFIFAAGQTLAPLQFAPMFLVPIAAVMGYALRARKLALIAGLLMFVPMFAHATVQTSGVMGWEEFVAMLALMPLSTLTGYWLRLTTSKERMLKAS
jgi:hypothetical protein